MKYSFARYLAVQLVLASAAFAGTAPDFKSSTTMLQEPPAMDQWEFTISPYAWGAGLNGTMGVKGFTAGVDVPVDEVVKNLDMIAFLNIEARRGRWGAWVDGLYLKMSVGTETSRPLLDSLGLTLEQVIVEGALFFRLLQSERGYVDVYAGARYMWVSSDLSLNISDSGLTQVSQDISRTLTDQIVASVRSQAQSSLTTRTSQIADNVAAGAREKLEDIVSERVDQARETIENLREIAAAHPGLAEKIRNNDELKDALKDAAIARIQERAAELEQATADAGSAVGAAKAELQAAAARARSRADKAVQKAEKKLSEAIEDALRDAIPDQISGSREWIDPFVGARVSYNLSDRWYLVAKADIGGFGVGSDLAWQAYGAMGYHLTKSKNTTLEVGYKYMSVDYTDGGFTYDLNISGAMLVLAFRF